MVKYTRMGQLKMHRFFLSKSYYSMEAASPDNNSDVAVNNTVSHSSVSFGPNKSIATPDTSQNLEDFMDSDFKRIHSATSIIRHVKTPSL